jgi:hypothetical protein
MSAFHDSQNWIVEMMVPPAWRGSEWVVQIFEFYFCFFGLGGKEK